MPRFEGQVVLITGASSGIGAALAREFTREGATVVLTARRKDRLEALEHELSSGGRRALAIEADVTRDGDLEAAVARAKSEFGRIDVVVANAGFGVGARLDRLTLADYRRQFETNIFGVLRAIYASLDELKKTRGRILIIGSIASSLPLPEGTPYCMSKAALLGLAGGLNMELRRDGVSVTHILPGFIKTEIFQVDNQGRFHENAKEDKKPPEWLAMPADTAARHIVRAAYKRKRRYIVTVHGKVLMALQRLLPGLIYRIIERSG